MSLERVIKALINLGLPRQDAEIYVYLTKSGPLSEAVLVKKLKIRKTQLTRTLNNLKHKEIIRNADRASTKVYAIPFEEALNLLIEINRQQNVALQEVKRELLASWKNFSQKNSENS